MKYRNSIFLLIFFLCIAFDSYAQEIKVTEFRSDPKDISARQNKVYDANGDACAVIKMRTGLQNVKVSSDLGVRKIEIHDGEYWLWVSPNTQQINIEAEGLGNLQYTLPQVAEEFGVYIILLTATLPDKVVFRKVNTYVLQSKPSKAEVYINNFYFGKTPAVINIPTDTIKYSVQKKKYLALTGEFVYDELHNWFSVNLKRDPRGNKFYLLAYAGGGNSYSTPVFGFELGKVGRTGWYLSIAPPLRSKRFIATYYGWEEQNSTFAVDPVKFQSVVGDSPDKYYVRLKDKNNTFNNNFRLKFGITQKIFNNGYLKAGFGFATVMECFRLNVIPYSVDPLSEIPLEKTYYARREYAIQGLTLETGFTYLIKENYLVNLNIASTGFSKWFSRDFVDILFPVEASLGLGYRF